MFKYFKQKNNKNKDHKVPSLSKGFTLVETLVAITIFSISVLTMMVILSGSITHTTYAKKKLIAEYLGQEGIEYMRNMRDTFMHFDPSGVAQTGWLPFVAKFPASCTGAPTANNGCYFDDRNVSYVDTTMPMEDLLFSACSASSCSNAPLLYDAATGEYGYVATATTTSSGFSRQINIDTSYNNAGNSSVKEVRVFSTVYWVDGTRTYSTSFSEDLFNWIE